MTDNFVFAIPHPGKIYIFCRRSYPATLATEEPLKILDSHPIFMGVCPKCSYKFDRDNPPLIHWDCPACGWIDDSV